MVAMGVEAIGVMAMGVMTMGRMMMGTMAMGLMMTGFTLPPRQSASRGTLMEPSVVHRGRSTVAWEEEGKGEEWVEEECKGEEWAEEEEPTKTLMERPSPASNAGSCPFLMNRQGGEALQGAGQHCLVLVPEEEE